MTIKHTLFHALLAAALASIASLIYNTIYMAAFAVDFSSILNAGGIIGSSTIGCMLMALGYFLAYKWKGDKLIPWLNMLIAVLSFVSIVGVLGMQLPLTVDSPELFPGLAIPMHFFPALSFFAVAPFFKLNKN